LGWQGRALLSAGRTDSGVHAEGQSIAFDLDWQHAPLELVRALNANLPADIAVRQARPVPDGFHPRYTAVARCYRYRLFCDPTRHPLRERYAWRIWPPVEVDHLEQTAAYLEGRHDFCAFGTPSKTGGSTVRSVLKAEWSQVDHGLDFEIVGNSFLFRMVRRLVAYQVESSQINREPASILELLDSPGRKSIQGLAPPQGLTLVEVAYPQELA
jgi:tRNA pseudouridine38-40 synthase